jgi:conjugative relaxase-like TrwC/TraI family protein
VDYYLDPDERPGRWCGSGTPALGLDGEVTLNELRALLDGRHPVTGAKLGRGFGDASARGFDATFSAPKSVSALWALTPDRWVRAEVLAAHDAAVDAALGWFEGHGAVTRRGTNGIDQVDTRGVAVARFRQHTSRTLDPQLHTHAIIASKVQDPTGKWLSLDARFLKRQQFTISWIYDAALRTELTARLGLDWETLEEDAGQTDLVAIPKNVRDEFSKRAAQVQAKLTELIGRWSDEHDGAEPDTRTIAYLERRAVTASRPSKVHGVDADQLHRDWAQVAAGVGFDPSTLEPSSTPRPAAPVDADAIVAAALARVEGDLAAWLPADLSRHIATLIPVGAVGGAAELTGLVDRLTDHALGRCLPLNPARPGEARRVDGRPVSEAVTDHRFTSQRVWDQESDLISWGTAATAATAEGSSSTDEVVHAVSGANELTLVVGPAGAGKTYALARAILRLQDDGRPMIGLAPSGKAADVLAREAGCPAVTLARLLVDQRAQRLPMGTTVILDEAGMASTEDLDHLVRLARTRGWRLVCVGDPDQLPAVGRGGMFAHWCDTLPAHHLDQVHRFTEPWQAEASLALRRGDPAADGAYAAAGRVRAAHPALAPHVIARTHARLTESGETVSITCASAGTAREINLAIQAGRHLDDRGAPLADGTRAQVGDCVATRRNDSTLTTDQGKEVRNRHTWTVTNVGHHGGLTVHDKHLGTAVLPAAYVAAHVELGWAVTGYGNQGATTDHAIAVIEPSSTRAGAYVAMTRGRHRNIAVVLDPTGLADPAEVLEQTIAKPASAETAHATRDRLGGPEPGTLTLAPTAIDVALARLDHSRNRGPDRSLGL